MATSDELEALRKHGLKLKREIRSVNRELDRALRAVANGRSGRSLRILEARFEDYADLKFELGRVTGEILQLRTRTREHEQRGWKEDRSEEGWQGRAQDEDRLAWLELEEPEQDADQNTREQDRDREEVRRGREPDDYLSWWER